MMANMPRVPDAAAMGYSREHTESTRARILDSAARLFRSRGYDAASIDEIMAGGALTRGGFYLHFRSKQELFAAYVGRELDFGRQLRRASEREPETPLNGAAEALDFYLSPGNRGRVARGCTVVSNAADVARSPQRTRRAFTRAFEGMREEFERVAAGTPDPDAAALAAIATCVGGVVLGRALADEALVERLLAACRRAVAHELGEPG
jgi:TetR/AcrR family transcriptional repressor of nem operon